MEIVFVTMWVAVFVMMHIDLVQGEKETNKVLFNEEDES